MISSAVVNRYANALVDVVLSQSSGMDPALAAAQLRSFEAAVKSANDLEKILASPAVPAGRKREVIRRLADALGLERIILNFILVLSDHRRAHALSEMIAAFELLADGRGGFVHAEVVSATELSEEQRGRLAEQLAKLAASQVRMRYSTDPDLIGGVLARVGSKVYDGSVRGQLAVLRQRLAV